MDPWIVWTVVAVAFAIGEIFTLGFFLAPFAVGAAAAAAVDGVGGGTAMTWAAFLVVSTISLAALRPVARSHRTMPPALRTGTAALVGHDALVRERVHRHGGTVLLDGEVWTARPLFENDAFEPGASVSVAEIRGATALVIAD